MKITWFGHAAFRLEFADKVVLIDPFLTGDRLSRATRPRRRGASPISCSPMAMVTIWATRLNS